MYLGNRDETHHVTVTITNGGGDVLFEKEYQLSDSNEADEDATFPASTNPETIVVIVDGTRFERDWPGFEQPALPCDGPNEAGIEIYVENDQDGTPDIRLEADCQSITGEEPPTVETRIDWDAEFASYEVELVDGRFTDANTGELAVRVTFPDDDPYRKVWAGGKKADRFPVEAGDELVVTTGQRGTVRLLWRPPGDGDMTVLDTYRRSAQPTPTVS